MKEQNSINVWELEECSDTAFWGCFDLENILNKKTLNPYSVWNTLNYALHSYIDIIVKDQFSVVVKQPSLVWKQGCWWRCFAETSVPFTSTRAWLIFKKNWIFYQSHLKPCFHLRPEFLVQNYKFVKRSQTKSIQMLSTEFWLVQYLLVAKAFNFDLDLIN